MKKILGLDLGTNSIGWALVKTNFEEKSGEISGAGSRIIPMSQDILGKFDSGQSHSQTAERTGYRGVRRLFQRDNLRRERLHRVLNKLGFLPEHYANEIDFEKRLGQFKPNCEPKLNYRKNNDGKFEFIFMDSFTEMVKEFQNEGHETKIPLDWTIYYLRKKALTQKISKEEFAWLILNFNQKRGYYQTRSEIKEENKKKEETFYSLKVKHVEETDDKNNKGIWYNITLENDWVYRRQSKESLNHWVGKTKEFIVTTQFEDDGSEKRDKEGNIHRSFRAPKEEDWGLVKLKSQGEIDRYNIAHKTVGVGSYIFDSLLKNPTQKIRGKLIKTIERDYYKKELNAILEEQIKYHEELQDRELYHACIEELYPRNEAHRQNIKDKDFVYLFKDDIIFYHRPLKSQKSQISGCKFETRTFINPNLKKGSDIPTAEPIKVVPKSHPLFQEFRLWEFIQNLRIYKRIGEVDGKTVLDLDVTSDFLSADVSKTDLFDFLNSRKEIKQDQLLAYFMKSRKEQKLYRWNYVEDKVYPCNETRATFLSRLQKVSNIDINKIFTSEFIFQLWHIIYSVNDKKEFDKALKTFATKNKLDIDSFYKAFQSYPPFKNEYGAYSEKALKKLLPLIRLGKYWDFEAVDSNTKDRILKLLTGEWDESIANRVREKAYKFTDQHDFQGLPLWLASYIVYDRHSESDSTNQWKTPQDIDSYLEEFKQHSLRNPIVEQVVTETLRTVRDIWQHYGNGEEGFFDEIHIELGREMKNPADKRKQISDSVTKNENTNIRIKALLRELMNDPTIDGDVRDFSPSHQEILKIYEEGALLNPDANFSILKEDDILKLQKSNSPTQSEIQKYKLWLDQNYISPYTGKAIPLSKLFTSAYEIEHIIPQSRYFDNSMKNKVICESEVNRLKNNQTAYEFIKNHGSQKVDLGQGQSVEVFSLGHYEEHCRRYFGKNRSKLNMLLSEDIPEGFINRQLNDSRYISKLVKGLLSNIVREEDDAQETSKHVISVNGTITARLKRDWGLNDKWNELVQARFKRLNEMTGTTDFGYFDSKINAFRCQVPDEISKGFNIKRIDHRHHALDALVIALATRNHVNYLNNASALRGKKTKNERDSFRHDLKNQLCYKSKPDDKGNYKWFFYMPWENFVVDAKNTLETTLVSFKQNLRVINKTTNKTWQWVEQNGKLKKVRVPQTKGNNWAIRKPMHKDTVSGLVKIKRNKGLVSLAKALETPDLIAEKPIKKMIKTLLKEHEGDTKSVKKALKDKPLEFNGEVISKVNVFEIVEATATRTKLDENFTRKNLESVTDSGIRTILENHIKFFIDEKGKERFDLAFNQDGIEQLNKNIVALNNGKKHQPIYHVRLYEVGSKFSISESGTKASKFVEAAKGTNLFFAVYWNDGKQKREYEAIPLNDVIKHQKKVAHLPKEQRTEIPVNPDKGKFLFSLSPNDLVYVPSEQEKENPELVNFSRLNKEQCVRVYKMVSSTGTECHFIPYSTSKEIKKNENGTNSKSERLQDLYNGTCIYKDNKPIMIKEVCWKLKVNRLGHIIEVIR